MVVRPSRRTSDRHVSNASACPTAARTVLEPPRSAASRSASVGESLCVTGHVGADGGNELGVAEEELEFVVGVCVPRPDLSEREGEALSGSAAASQRLCRRERVEQRPVARAGGEERVLVREMRIDGVPLDARFGGDRGDRGAGGADRRVQRDGCLDDPPPCLGLALGALLLLVRPSHYTPVYSEFDIGGAVCHYRCTSLFS